MDFDERLLTKTHVLSAIRIYLRDKPKHRPARSAFLFYRGHILPAKYILRLAFKEVCGFLLRAEQLTGGRASVRVLHHLGFNAVFKKSHRKTRNVNSVKNKRRRAFKSMLENRFGPFLTEKRIDGIYVPELTERRDIDPVLLKVLTATETARKRNVCGRQGFRLAFDFFSEKLGLAIEFDERQHFTSPREISLKAYPSKLALGYDRKRWIALCCEIQAGDNSPAYRDEQRAFYDSIRDIMAPRLGLLPVVRIFEEEVAWEKALTDETEARKARQVLDRIQRLIKTRNYPHAA